jgi:glycosyltransferase involved in cell wall biosynthesis
VWNDAARLEECLRALDGQTYPSDSYEVVVVDNDSTEPVGHVVARHARARLLREVRPGSYAARNAGLAHARGEAFAFTDADCLPAPDWVEKGVARLSRGGGRAVVAGSIEIFPREAAAANAVEQYELIFALAQGRYVMRYEFGATANLFAMREVFERVGPFLAELKSGGDIEWGRRIKGRGYVLEYAEDVRVRHPARASLSQLYSKIVRVAGGFHDLKRIKGRDYLGFDRGLLLELLPPLPTVARILRGPSTLRVRDRVKVCAVVLFVRYAQTFERLRLSLSDLWNRHTKGR